MRVLDPRGDLAKAPQSAPMRELDSLQQRRIGFLWGQHAASVKFWPVFEEAIEEQLRPASVFRLYKSSTWNPASDDEIADIATKIDVALVGVGA